jgi:hypothetical protein
MPQETPPGNEGRSDRQPKRSESRWVVPAAGASRGEIGRPVNRLEVARAEDTILVRVIGLGSVNNAGSLWDFASQSFADGWRRIAFDLADCRGLDSTFLGTIVGISQEIEELASRGPAGWVCVVNASSANKELFEIVGADKYVRFKPSVEMAPLETEPLATGLMSTDRRLELVRRAHENLVKIDERNQARFGEFLKCLAAELARRGDEPEPD